MRCWRRRQHMMRQTARRLRVDIASGEIQAEQTMQRTFAAVGKTDFPIAWRSRYPRFLLEQRQQGETGIAAQVEALFAPVQAGTTGFASRSWVKVRARCLEMRFAEGGQPRFILHKGINLYCHFSCQMVITGPGVAKMFRCGRCWRPARAHRNAHQVFQQPGHPSGRRGY